MDQLEKNIRRVIKGLSHAQCNVCGKLNPFSRTIDSLRTIVSENTAQNIILDLYNQQNLRESIACDQCGSISRDRGLIYGLMFVMNETRPISEWIRNPSFRIFETTGYRGHPVYLDKLFDYYHTEYSIDELGKSQIDGRRFADAQSMPYPNSFFDVYLSSDVFEHVRLHEQAIRETYRVLKPGGYFILQVPYVHSWSETLVKVHPWGDKDSYLSPPEYHAEDTLVYRVYGRDLLSLLKQVGYSVGHIFIDVPELGISHQSVIIAAKADFLDLTSCIKLVEAYSLDPT